MNKNTVSTLKTVLITSSIILFSVAFTLVTGYGIRGDFTDLLLFLSVASLVLSLSEAPDSKKTVKKEKAYYL